MSRIKWMFIWPMTRSMFIAKLYTWGKIYLLLKTHLKWSSFPLINSEGKKMNSETSESRVEGGQVGSRALRGGLWGCPGGKGSSRVRWWRGSPEPRWEPTGEAIWAGGAMCQNRDRMREGKADNRQGRQPWGAIDGAPPEMQEERRESGSPLKPGSRPPLCRIGVLCLLLE